MIETDKGYDGYVEQFVDSAIINRFYKDGQVAVSDLKGSFYPNEFVILKDVMRTSSSAIGKVDLLGQNIKPLIGEHEHVWGIKPRNAQQKNGFRITPTK